MVDYSLYRRWAIASAVRAMRRLSEHPEATDIEKLRAAAALLFHLPFGTTSHD